MGIVDDAVEDGVGEGGIADHIVPAVDWELTGDQGSAAAVAFFGDLALARGDGRYPRLMRALGGVKLLILDDWGLEPLGPEQRHDMLEIVEDRYGRGATLITSQIPVDRWHDLIGEPTLADAILDRIIHNAHRLQLKGDSLRKQIALKIAAA